MPKPTLTDAARLQAMLLASDVVDDPKRVNVDDAVRMAVSIRERQGNAAAVVWILELMREACDLIEQNLFGEE